MPDEGMSSGERRALVARDDPDLPIAAQCRLLKVARSTLYYQPTPVDPDDLALMRRMDELDTKWPFYGSRRMVAALRQDGVMVNRKRVRRLMRVMGLEAIYQKPNTSKGHPDHKVYPYLLRGLAIERPNQVWCADITYIPMAKAFVYLVAVMDWFSRRVLAWRVSITLEADFCVEALQEVIPSSGYSTGFAGGTLASLARHGQPEIFNTDQGVQFISAGFLDELESHAIRVSMDGKGRFLDNIFIERLWRNSCGCRQRRQLREVDLVGRPRAKAGVRPLGVEEIQIPPDRAASLGDRFIGPQIDLLVLHRPP
jgi:putative transposase